MARKSLPASRKRRTPSSEPALPQQGKENLIASASTSTQAAVHSAKASASDDPFLPPAQVPSPLNGPPSHPSPRSHGYKDRAIGDIQNKRKRLHACEHKKQVALLIEEMYKVLSMAGSFHEVNALPTSYASHFNLLFGAKKSTSFQDLISSLSNLSAWMDNVRPRVNAEFGISHCLNDINCTNATDRLGSFSKHGTKESKVLTNPIDVGLLALHFEIIKEALVNEVEERNTLNMRFLGQNPNLSALMNVFLNSLDSTCKKSWVGSVSREAVNVVSRPGRKSAFVGQEEYDTKSDAPDRVQTQSRLGVDKERPADIDTWKPHQMSCGELESWIVRQSVQSKERRNEIAGMKPTNLEKIDKDCLESWTDNHVEIEVELSGRHGSLLEEEVATANGISDMPYVKYILKTISLSRVNLDGQDDVIVLFKAVRSDGKEIIVDNAYLRCTHPRLLATFYEQNLCCFVGKTPSGRV